LAVSVLPILFVRFHEAVSVENQGTSGFSLFK